jgi:colicin import membrane protein
MKRVARAILLQAVLLGSLVLALTPARADEAAERERIARERSEATARHDRQRRECEQRFAVTACVDEARAEHRQTMMQLRRQEALLDEAQRKQRAAQRLAEIEQKTRQERSAAPGAQLQASAVQPRKPRLPAVAASRPAALASAASASPAASAPQRRADEARSRARFDARQRDAAMRREAAEQRRLEREKGGKPPSAPLPDPAAR